MPPISQVDAFTLLLQEISYPDVSPVPHLLQVVWGLYAEKAIIAPNLQYWYTKRHVLDMVMSGVWQDVTVKEADEENHQSDKSLNLKRIRDNIQAEIDKLEAIARGGRAPVVAQLTTTAPIMPCAGQPNPNSRVYRGDPLRRR